MTLSTRPVLAVLLLCMAIAPRSSALDPARCRALADEVRQHFDRHILAAWFPHCIDTEKGGFGAGFDREWKPTASPGKFLVFQSRMTWVSAQVAMCRPERREEYLKYTRHGVAMLHRMWDAEQGGLFWGVDDDAKVTSKFGDYKHAYGISFGIYALAAAYEATGDPEPLQLAMKTFSWFDNHAHDARNGGYHEALSRNGTPIVPEDLARTLAAGTPGPNRVAGYKSMNSHIHLLEAFTQLHHARTHGRDARDAEKNDLVKRRLEELFLIVRDKIAVEPGCLNLFFTPDWRAVPDHDSFGHDIETAFLLLEAEEVLGQRPDHARTLTVARQLVDHALDWGFDSRRGGFYDRGAAFDRAHETAKIWWTQAEGLNALLLMHEHFGDKTDRYARAFELTWKFVNEFQVDREKLGWYETVSAEGKLEKATKASIWKAAYHDGRALMTMEARLRRLGTR